MTNLTNNPEVLKKPVGVLLGFGIFLMPLIFVWFTLQKGRSALAKTVAFVWLAVWVIFVGANDHKPNTTATLTSTSATTQPSKSSGNILDKIANKEMAKIENKVAEDAVTQYQIAERNGTKIDICVQAGMVSAAWLQAKNEQEYANWKAVQTQKCKAAGMPSM